MLLVRTYLGKSEIHGIGVFAAEDIAEGVLVWEFNPVVDRLISRAEFDVLPDLTKEMIRHHAEFVERENAFVLSGDNDRFMNHGDIPNTRDEGRRLYSSAFIPAHAEITCDYREVRVLDFIPAAAFA